MRIQETDRFLRQYSEYEKEVLVKQIRGIAPDNREPGLMAGEQFIKEYEEAGIYRHDRFRAVGEHYHDYIELAYIWSGSFVQHINGKRVSCSRGDVCILNTRAVHSIEICGEDDIMVNILMRKELFDHAFIGRLARQGVLAEFLIGSVMERQSRNNYLLFHTAEVEGFQELICRIITEFYSERLGRTEVMKSYISVMFTELLRSYQEREQEQAETEKDIIVFQLLAYIEKHYQDCSLTSMADVFGFHPAYLTAMLKQQTGKSFLEHVHEQKLNKARNLLAGTDASVTDIAALCGYQNLSFFYKKFKAAEGMTPAAWREHNREVTSFYR